MPILLSDQMVDVGVLLPAALGMAYAMKEAVAVTRVPINGHPDQLAKQDSQAEKSTEEIVTQMKFIAGVIQDGSDAFLLAEYKYMLCYIVLFSCVLGPFCGIPTTIAFVVGSLTSILAGYIGMKIATLTNVRCAHECWKDLESGYYVAIRGGCVMGLSLCAIGVLVLYALIFFLKKFYTFEDEADLYDAIAGYGLGGSSIALFGRVAGGIYTKAADVGADLSGKNEYGMDEDDPRNPACIADNVGDNVGDIAGMGADLFGSFAEATCAALVLAASTKALAHVKASMMYPVLISSSGIFIGLITLIIVGVFYPVKEMPDVEKALKLELCS